MARQIRATWDRTPETGMLELVLRIPVQPYQPNARQSGWSFDQRRQIAELVAAAAEAAVKAVEEVGL